MIKSTTRKVTRFKYAATLVGALAIVAFAPATAYAADNDPSGPGGCHYSDADGYNIPIQTAKMFLSTARSSPAAMDRSSSPLRRSPVSTASGR